MVSVEHEAPQFGAKVVPIQVRWQTPHQQLPLRGLPVIQTVTCIVGGDPQILQQNRLAERLSGDSDLLLLSGHEILGDDLPILCPDSVQETRSPLRAGISIFCAGYPLNQLIVDG